MSKDKLTSFFQSKSDKKKKTSKVQSGLNSGGKKSPNQTKKAPNTAQEEWKGIPYAFPKGQPIEQMICLPEGPKESPAKSTLYAEAFKQQPNQPVVQSCPFDLSEQPTHSGLQQLLAAGKAAPTQEEKKPCCVRGVTVKCGHAKRNFTLIPPSTKTNEKYEQVIQLLADNNEADQLILGFDAGPCIRGKGPAYPALNFNSMRMESGTILNLQTYPMPITNGEFGLYDFMKLFLTGDETANVRRYSFDVSCCEGGQEFAFSAEVYPNMKWDGEVTLGYEFYDDQRYKTYKPADFKKVTLSSRHNKEKPYRNEGKLVFSGKLEGSYGKHKFSIGGEISGHTRKNYAEGALGHTNKFLGKILPSFWDFSSSPLVEIKPRWPKIVRRI